MANLLEDIDSVEELVYTISEPRLLRAQNGTLAYWCNRGLRDGANQDAQFINTQYNIFASIDGMGGHRHGDLAASLLAEECRQTIRDYGCCLHKEVAEEIQRRAHERMKESHLGSGGACYLIFRVIDDYLTTCHAGDVKLVLFDADSRVVFETKDHKFPGGSVVGNAVTGRAAGQVDDNSVTIAKGQRIVAASDGLWNSCPPEQVAEMIRGKNALDGINCLRSGALDQMKSGRVHKDNINMIFYDLERLIPSAQVYG